MFLSDLKPSGRAVITMFSAPRELREHAASMGLLCGVPVTMLAWSGEDRIVRVMHTKIAVGGVLASKIRVQAAPAEAHRA